MHASGHLDVSQFQPFVGTHVVRWRPPVYSPGLEIGDSVFFHVAGNETYSMWGS